MIQSTSSFEVSHYQWLGKCYVAMVGNYISAGVSPEVAVKEASRNILMMARYFR